jgi:hypothetical protein
MKKGFVICFDDGTWPQFLMSDKWCSIGPYWTGQKTEKIQVFEGMSDCLEIFEDLLENNFYPLTIMRTRDIDRTFENAERIEEWWKNK